MKLKYQFDMSEVCGKIAAVPVWDDKPVFEGIITLNSTAAFIIDNLDHEITEKELQLRFVEKFSCSDDEALANIEYILAKLRNAELLVE